METIPKPQGPHDPPPDVQVPDGDVREPPFPNDQRSERFPGKNDSGGRIEKDA